MSTKTNFKRIALVAVAALGLGVLSSVPSQAAVSGLTVTAVDGTASLALSDSTTAATITVNGIMELNDSMTVEVVQTGAPAGAGNFKVFWINLDSTTSTQESAKTKTDSIAVTVSGAGQTAVAGDVLQRLPVAAGGAGTNTETAVAVTNGAGTNKVRFASLATTPQVVGQKLGLQLDSATARTAGTYSYRVFTKVYNRGTAQGNAATAQLTPDQTITTDINIVVAAALDASKTAAASGSFAFISNTSTTSTTSVVARADSSISVVATAAASNIGFIFVGNRNAAGGITAAQESLTATVTGPGVVGDKDSSVFGKSIKVAATGDYEFKLRSDGTAGTSTVTITAGVTGLTYVKTLTYYSAAAKTITATVAAPLLKIGSNSKAVRGVAVDANGLQWAGQAYIVASSAADALVAGSTTPVACTYSAADLRHDCSVTAVAVGTAKFKIIDAATVAAATATSNEVTVTVTNAVIANVKISFDKATYAPNERARIYVTPVDAAGKEMQANDYTGVFTAGIVVNGALSFTGTATTADSMTAAGSFTSASIASSTSGAKAGSMQFTVYMPSAGGVVTLTATGGTGLALANQGAAITASATVTDSGAAALAAVTALATTVASLKTLITTLTNLVLKIQKKVKA